MRSFVETIETTYGAEALNRRREVVDLVFGRVVGYIERALIQRTGDNLGVTHTAIRPGTNELYICTNDAKNGAWIFKTTAFAKASLSSYQYR